MDISIALAADLAALTEMLDESDIDLETQLDAFTAGVKLAASSYLGMTMTIAVNGNQVSFTALEDAAMRTAAIATSLLIPLSAVSGAEPGSTLVLYAAAPGAFVDLAANLDYALRLHHTALVLDDYLAAPANGAGSGASGLEGAATINRAIGALITRGHTPKSAREEMAQFASLDGRGILAVAEKVLRTILTSR